MSSCLCHIANMMPHWSVTSLVVGCRRFLRRLAGSPGLGGRRAGRHPHRRHSFPSARTRLRTRSRGAGTAPTVEAEGSVPLRHGPVTPGMPVVMSLQTLAVLRKFAVLALAGAPLVGLAAHPSKAETQDLSVTGT